jgi:hypothetical protein
MPASPSDPPPLPRQHRPPRTPRSPRSPASASAPAPAGEAAIRILGGLAEPRPTRVEATAQGVPLRVEGRAVESIRETWQVEEGWWTASPVRRRYHEVVIAGGRLLTLYEDLVAGTWHSQRGS